MNTYLLDASVILKWFIEDEELITKALQFRQSFLEGKIDLVLFDLSYLEVTNILSCKKCISSAQIKKVITALDLLNIPVKQTDSNILKKAVEISKKYHLSMYDATYVALAKSLKVKFITCDEKMFNQVHLEIIPKHWRGRRQRSNHHRSNTRGHNLCFRQRRENRRSLQRKTKPDHMGHWRGCGRSKRQSGV